MAKKTKVKVTVDSCGLKATDNQLNNYEIDMNFSNEEARVPHGEYGGVLLGYPHYPPGKKFTAQILANNKLEIL